MSFVTQQEVFDTIQPVIEGIFTEFADFTGETRNVQWMPDIPYKEAMAKYGSDKPDLRNPLEIVDVTSVFARDDVEFNAFKNVIKKGGVVRAIRAPKVADQPRSFFDKLNGWAQKQGAPGLGYILIKDGAGAGPIAKFVPDAAQAELKTVAGLEEGDAIFFICNNEKDAAKMAGLARDAICDFLSAIEGGHEAAREQGVYKFCWIVDFPMYELIRNHRPEIMEKAFGLAGYSKDVLEEQFGGMLNAMRYGAPPHGGLAFGVDRIVMLLADEPNLREVYAFVMNGQYEDQMMAAPSAVDTAQLQDLHLKLSLPKKVVESEEAA